MSAAWVYDAPTGTYQSPPVSAYLWSLSAEEGPCCRYGFVEIAEETSIGALGNVDTLLPEHEVLVRQARLLRCFFPSCVPHLRVAIPQNYGREKGVAWYDFALERKLLKEAEPIPGPIVPRDVLPVRFFTEKL